jgi:hypothetical protein
MLVLDRASPIRAEEALAIAADIGQPVGVAGYAGGPCASEVWPADVFVSLQLADIPVASFWVGSNTGCWFADFSPETATTQGARAVHDADARYIADRPLVLDVEANTVSTLDRHTLLDYVGAWARAVRAAGGHPWLYSLQALINDALNQPEWEGFWVADWQPSWQPIPPPPSLPRPACRQYSSSQTLSSRQLGPVDVSVAPQEVFCVNERRAIIKLAYLLRGREPSVDEVIFQDQNGDIRTDVLVGEIVDTDPECQHGLAVLRETPVPLPSSGGTVPPHHHTFHGQTDDA